MRKYFRKFKYNSLAYILIFLNIQISLSVIPIKAFTLGRMHKPQAWININKYNDPFHKIGVGGNYASINTLVDNKHPHLIYYLTQDNPPNLSNALDDIIYKVLNAPIITAHTALAGNSTLRRKFSSGSEAAIEVPFLCSRNHIQATKNAYSDISFSDQGTFNIEAPIGLYHTEPKALNYLLDMIEHQPPNHHITDVILISKNAMCSCCSRLLLGILHQKKALGNINVIILSYAQAEKYFSYLTSISKQLTNNTTLPANLATSLTGGGGNQLVLLSHYELTPSTASTSPTSTTPSPTSTTPSPTSTTPSPTSTTPSPTSTTPSTTSTTPSTTSTTPSTTSPSDVKKSVKKRKHGL